MGSPQNRFHTQEIAECLLEALENEQVLDRFIAERYLSSDQLIGIPDFKQLRLVPLKRLLGVLTTPVLFAAALLVWPKLFFECLAYLLIWPLLQGRSHGRNHHIFFDFLETRQALLEEVVSSDDECALVALNKLDAIARIPFRTLVKGPLIAAKLMALTLRKPWPEIVSLSLQAHNIASIMLAGLYIRSQQDVTVVTTSILQRWLYVFSKLARHVWAIQHGYVLADVPFIHHFSNIERIYAYSPQQFTCYGQYYEAEENFVIVPNLTLENYENSSNSVFLASSFPFIDQETALLRELRSAAFGPISVKLHPGHLYDSRAKDLLALADIIIPADVDPECRIFLSHSSFYGLLYQYAGIPTYAFSEFETLNALLDELRDNTNVLSKQTTS